MLRDRFAKDERQGQKRGPPLAMLGMLRDRFATGRQGKGKPEVLRLAQDDKKQSLMSTGFVLSS
jgi:hypothetical protein